MKRVWSIALFAAIAVLGSLAQTGKDSNAAARQEVVDPPVVAAGSPALSADASRMADREEEPLRFRSSSVSGEGTRASQEPFDQ